MMRSAIALAVLAVLPVASRAATAIVFDPDGQPVADAVVMCSEHTRDALLSGPNGRVTLPDWCRALTCMRGKFLPGRAAVVDESAVCRLSAGSIVTIRLNPPGCGPACRAVLRPIGKGGDPASGQLNSDTESGTPEVRLDPVPPGVYVAELYDYERGWHCRRSVELPLPGEAIIDAAWRPPLEVTGVVLDESGRPVADIPVRAVAAGDGTDLTTFGWRCEANDDVPDRFSAADGSFRVPVDPDGRTVIAAGSSWDPDGHVEVEIAPPLPEPLTLRLRKAGR